MENNKNLEIVKMEILKLKIKEVMLEDTVDALREQNAELKEEIKRLKELLGAN